MGTLLSTALGLSLLAFRIAIARNITFDNTSPQVVFSPLPCFQQDAQGCSIQWQLQETIDAFNGSVTTTTGTNFSTEQDVLSRVSLAFQGTDVVFMPGLHSTALASVIVDDLASILINTSRNAFSGTGLDPTRNHTITITFVPHGHRSTTLDVDYFLVMQPDGNGTSPSTSSLFPMPLPTSLPPTSSSSSPSPTSSPSTAPVPVQALAQSIPTGTIAAISLSGGLLLIIAIVAGLVITRRRRRRAVLQRERSILYDLRLPSDPGLGNGRPKGAVGERQWDESAWRDAGNREKGKARESAPPPVHYTPWR